MADLQISVFPDSAQAAIGELVQEEKITISGTSAQTSVLSGTRKNRTVRVYADADCYITWGINPTALIDGTEGRMVGANNPEYFLIPAGYKLAAILR